MQSATVRNFQTVRREGNRMVTCNMDYYKLDMIINPIKSRKTIFLIRVATSAERYCNEELFWLSQSASYSKAVPSRTTWRRALMPRQPYSVAVPSTGGRLHP